MSGAIASGGFFGDGERDEAETGLARTTVTVKTKPGSAEAFGAGLAATAAGAVLPARRS